MGSPGMISIWASACVACASRFEPRRATAEAARVEALRKERRELEGDFNDMRKRSPVTMQQYRPSVCGASTLTSQSDVNCRQHQCLSSEPAPKRPSSRPAGVLSVPAFFSGGVHEISATVRCTESMSASLRTTSVVAVPYLWVISCLGMAMPMKLLGVPVVLE